MAEDESEGPSDMFPLAYVPYPDDIDFFDQEDPAELGWDDLTIACDPSNRRKGDQIDQMFAAARFLAARSFPSSWCEKWEMHKLE